jgi:hypothetical protein
MGHWCIRGDKRPFLEYGVTGRIDGRRRNGAFDNRMIRVIIFLTSVSCSCQKTFGKLHLENVCGQYGDRTGTELSVGLHTYSFYATRLHQREPDQKLPIFETIQRRAFHFTWVESHMAERT